MALLEDLTAKRIEMNNAIDNYKQAVLDFHAGTATPADVDAAKAAAVTKGDEYAKLTSQVKQDDPAVTNDDQLFSRPSVMNALARQDVATIMTTGKMFGQGMKLLVDTEGTTVGATNAILSFAEGSDITIDWGDSSGYQSYTGAASHDYATPGQYTVEVHGTVNGFTGPLTESRQQLKDVMQWGLVEFASATAMFTSRAGFVISASDSPTFLPGATCIGMFSNATDFNSNIDHWDVSNVVNMEKMFFNATAFNQPLNSWDMSNATNIAFMFYTATAFNQPLNAWNVANVATMERTFRNAINFNQPLNSWNTANVTDMTGMFYDAAAFNRPLNLWNVANVTTMLGMFYRAYAFNQDLSGWNVGNVTNYGSFNNNGIIDSNNLPNFV